MDFSRFKTPDWLIIGGGLVFLIGGFLDWISVEFEGDLAGLGSSGANVFDFFWTGILPWLLIIGSAVITFLLVSGQLKTSNVPWPMIVLLATALGALLVLLRFIVPSLGEDVPDEIDVGRGIGLILCTLAAIVAAVGAFLNFKASGGDVRSLTDPDTYRSSFNRPGGSPPTGTTGTPPPPPPSSPPPPPPTV